jgi:hypothetical protein
MKYHMYFLDIPDVALTFARATVLVLLNNKLRFVYSIFERRQ